MPTLAVSGYFLAILSDSKLLLNGNIFFDHPEEFDDRQVCDVLKVISNESIDHDDPKEFDDPQLFKDPRGISIGSMGLIIQRSTVHCSDTSILDGLVLTCLISYHIHNYYNHSYHFRCVHLFYHIFVLNASPRNIVNSSFVSSVRSSNSHTDLLLTQQHHHPTFSDHTGPQHWTFTF